MKVTLSSSAGFCVGVKRAVDIALAAAGENDEIYMLGDIVHNEHVVKQVKAAGIKKINKLSGGAGKTLLIRAHGAPLSTYRNAEDAGYGIIDATCPMVKEIQKIARDDEKKGRTIIIIGDEKHEEVIGIKGSLRGEPVILGPKEPLPINRLKTLDKCSVVVQSTQNIDGVLEIVKELSSLIKDLRFHDTICSPTKNRQKEARALPLKNDAMVVIGSRTSANTKRLYQISKKLNERTFWISSAKDLKKSMFKDAKSVGVLAGASTPDEIIREAVIFLEKI